MVTANGTIDNRQNNFGFLRLLFATLVIVSHSSEIIDGNRSREPLTILFGVLSFGELAVDGFFLISGYLIAKSFESSETTQIYLLKRIRRLYPGYLVAYFVCIFVIGPFVGVALAALTYKDFARICFDSILLSDIKVPGFIGMPYQKLNGSMWTLIIEFRCYLFVILFGTLGFYRNKWIFVALTFGLLIAMGAKFHPEISAPLHLLLGDSYDLFRLLGMFCVGSCFYLFRNTIPFRRTLALIAASALLFLLSNSSIAEAAFGIFGGYLIFWFALHFKSTLFQRLNGTDDISYGVYLYAWPIQSGLVYFFQIHSSWLLMLITIPIVYATGFASWRFVEKRFTAYKSLEGEQRAAWP